TTCTATSPAGTGAVDVQVTTPGGTSASNPAGDLFTYGPTVTAVSPNAGPLAGGTAVTITGTGFTGATGVSFGAAGAATGVIVVTSTTITATSPGPGSGPVDVKVTTAAGTSPTNAPGDQFTYAAVPTVTALSAHSGPAAGGTTLTITGTNFTSAT